MVSGSERLCYQMHGPARVEAKGATLCGPSERQERRRLVARFDGRARARSKFDCEQLRRHDIDLDESRIWFESLID